MNGIFIQAPKTKEIDYKDDLDLLIILHYLYASYPKKKLLQGDKCPFETCLPCRIDGAQTNTPPKKRNLNILHNTYVCDSENVQHLNIGLCVGLGSPTNKTLSCYNFCIQNPN